MQSTPSTSLSDAVSAATDVSAGGAVFDRRVLEDMFGQEAGVIASVLSTFLDSMRTSTLDIEAAAAAGDLPLVAGLAHRVKGAARMSGAMAFGDAALVLERAAKDGSRDATRLAVLQFGRQWQQLVRDPALGALAGSAPAGPPGGI